MFKKTFYFITIFFIITTSVNSSNFNDIGVEEKKLEKLLDLFEIPDRFLDLPHDVITFHEVTTVPAWIEKKFGSNTYIWKEIPISSYVGIFEKKNDILFIIDFGFTESVYILEPGIFEKISIIPRYSANMSIDDWILALAEYAGNVDTINIRDAADKNKEWKDIAIDKNIETKKLLIENVCKYFNVENPYTINEHGCDIDFYSNNKLPYEYLNDDDSLILRPDLYKGQKIFTNLIWRFYSCGYDCSSVKMTMNEIYFEPENPDNCFWCNELFNLFDPLMILSTIADGIEQRKSKALLQ